MRNKLLLGTSILAALLVVLGVAGYLIATKDLVHYKDVHSVSKKAGFSVILPKNLPFKSEVIINPEYDKPAGVVNTSMLIDNHEVVFSQQKRPNTDLKQVDAEDTYLVNAGSVYVLKGEPGRLQAIVETTNTWIMVNANDKLGTDRFRAVLQSLDTV